VISSEERVIRSEQRVEERGKGRLTVGEQGTPSSLTPHSSQLTPHSSPLTPHSSQLTPNSSPPTPHSSQLTPSPSLPGINTKAGLEITQYNQTLYRRLLRRFAESQADFAGDFAAALAARAEDPDAPTRCAHTLKGLAANIGAEGVRRAAAALEAGCQAGADDGQLHELLADTCAALVPVLVGLEALAPAPGATATMPDAMTLDTTAPGLTPAVPDTEALAAQLTRLRALLQQDDTDAIRLVRDLAEQLGGSHLGQVLKPLSSALDAYDFEQALEALDEVEHALHAA